ncbi:unnamed protein product [Brassicogethes aeneus]|uniref:Solute carrier family 35 member B1 n=1 Tax=Brassicogethes aeneus TaxID=1431903 RepID=A0A9P0B9F1_BRAAE|nr:unnamed protein product [Brassicogethes aeneus]
MATTKQFMIYAAGIFVSYFYFGILQEKITRGKYSYEEVDSEGKSVTKVEKYTCTLTLVFIQCVTNYILAKIALGTKTNLPEDKTPIMYYASVSLTFLLAMVSSNMSLQWVSYPTQVVGKSAKPIPVMLLGVLIGNKSYALKKYVFVFLIVIGIVLFMLKDKAASATQEPMGIGEVLLLLSLTMDGLTGAVQERMRAETKPTGLQMMKTSNAWSVGYLAAAILLTGEIFKFIEFASRYPYIIYNLILLGFTSAIGSMFIYSMVSDFGPLPVSTVTTTRKFFTVLASVIIFGNSLTPMQWSGAALVFTSLFLDTYYGKKPQKVK